MEKPFYIKKLREKAEELLKNSDRKPENDSSKSFEELIEQLEIYQIELELQNEELKQTQESLQKSEEKYFNLFQFAPTSYIYLDDNLRIVEANFTALNLLKQKPDAYKGYDFRRFIAPHYQDDFLFFIRDISETKDRKELDLMLMIEHKNIVDVHIDAAAEFDANSNLLGYKLSLTDITKWKQQVSQVTLNDERYRFLTNIPDPVIIHINGIITYINKNAEDYFGYKDNFIVGKSVFEFINEADIPKVQQNMQNRFMGLPYADNYEIRVKHVDGRILTVLLKLTTIEFDSKQGDIVLLRDITERKIYEEKLIDFSSFHSVKSSLRSVSIDQSEHFIVNHFATKLLNEYEIEGISFLTFNLEQLNPELIIGLLRLPINNFRVKPELQDILGNRLPVINIDGLIEKYTIFDVAGAEMELNTSEVNYHLLPFIVDGKFEGAFLISYSAKNDFYKKNITKILDLTDELRMVVVEKRRKTQLERHLNKLKNDAEELSKAKTEFLANMSHEIRTPLNPIVGFTNYLLTEFRLPKDVVDILKLIDGSAKKLLKTLADILDMSKIESGSLSFTPTEFVFRDLMNDIVKEFTQRAEGLGYNFEVAINENIKVIYIGDYIRISQVLSNILDNAFKFSYKESSKIIFKIDYSNTESNLTTSKGYDWLEFQIIDEGIGIPEDKLETIFKIFSQVDNSFSKIYGGTGLGLAISSSIAYLMGGHITVESKQMEGSRFIIVLPLSTVVNNETASSTKYIPKMKIPTQQEPPKILIAEDDMANKFLLESILTQTEDYELSFAKNGEEVLKQFEKSAFDLILMDIKMPLLDGEKAAVKIRELEQSRQIKKTPIIAVTAQAGIGSKERYLNAGIDDVIYKPFSTTSLLSVLDKYLQNR